MHASVVIVDADGPASIRDDMDWVMRSPSDLQLACWLIRVWDVWFRRVCKVEYERFDDCERNGLL